MPTRSSPNSLRRTHNVTTVRVNGSESNLAPIHTDNSWVDTVTFGDNLKGWRDLLRRGLSATTSMTGSRIEARYTPGSARFEAENPSFISTSIDTVVLTGNMRATTFPTGDPASISATKADAEAMGKFLRKIRERQAAFQGGVFLGELAQTLAMIRNPARGLRGLVDETKDVLSNIRRLGFRNSLSRSRVTEQLADAWLELQFGWKPLLSDIDDGAKALAILNTGQSLHTNRITASHQTEVVTGDTTVNYTQNGVASWDVRTESKSRCITIFRGALRVEARNPAEMRRDLFGFNPNNFAPTIWNLIPYSFLIDYFTNVGDIIEGWSLLGTRLAWCNRTRKKTLVVTEVPRSDSSIWRKGITNPSTTLKSMAFSPAKVVIEKSSVTRAEYNQAMVPELVFQMPSLGSLKWLNIAALVAGRNNDRKWFYGD